MNSLKIILIICFILVSHLFAEYEKVNRTLTSAYQSEATEFSKESSMTPHLGKWHCKGNSEYGNTTIYSLYDIVIEVARGASFAIEIHTNAVLENDSVYTLYFNDSERPSDGYYTWNEYSTEKPIAELTVKDSNTLSVKWFGFYNKVTGKTIDGGGNLWTEGNNDLVRYWGRPSPKEKFSKQFSNFGTVALLYDAQKDNQYIVSYKEEYTSTFIDDVDSVRTTTTWKNEISSELKNRFSKETTFRDWQEISYNDEDYLHFIAEDSKWSVFYFWKPNDTLLFNASKKGTSVSSDLKKNRKQILENILTKKSESDKNKVIDEKYIENNFIELGNLISTYTIPFEESDGISLPWTNGAKRTGIYWSNDPKRRAKNSAKKVGDVSVTIMDKPSHIKDGKVLEKSWSIELFGANDGIKCAKIQTYSDEGVYINVPKYLDETFFDILLMGCGKNNTPANFRKLYYYHNDFGHGWMDINFKTDSTGGATMSYEILMYPPEGSKYDDLDRKCTE